MPGRNCQFLTAAPYTDNPVREVLGMMTIYGGNYTGNIFALYPFFLYEILANHVPKRLGTVYIITHSDKAAEFLKQLLLS